MDKNTVEILNVLAWVSFAVSLIFWGDIAIVGAILGFFVMRQSGRKGAFIANLVVLGLQFILGFLLASLIL